MIARPGPALAHCRRCKLEQWFERFIPHRKNFQDFIKSTWSSNPRRFLPQPFLRERLSRGRCLLCFVHRKSHRQWASHGLRILPGSPSFPFVCFSITELLRTLVSILAYACYLDTWIFGFEPLASTETLLYVPSAPSFRILTLIPYVNMVKQPTLYSRILQRTPRVHLNKPCLERDVDITYIIRTIQLPTPTHFSQTNFTLI